MFNDTPNDNVGLEWEPCHQLVHLIDPLPQIRKWAHKIFHLHGKDVTVRWDLVRQHDSLGKQKFAWVRTPGFGDSNWVNIISELRLAGRSGLIDIEGWHDPVYREAMREAIKHLAGKGSCHVDARAQRRPETACAIRGRRDRWSVDAGRGRSKPPRRRTGDRYIETPGATDLRCEVE